MTNEYTVTTFNAVNTKTKAPISPYNDKTFVFENLTVQNNVDFFNVLVREFVLNIPLGKLNCPTRTFRRLVDLSKYYETSTNYVVLDVDEVKSLDDKQAVINFFRPFKVVLGDSRSSNSIDNFNMKGVLFITETDICDLPLLISSIHNKLSKWCVVDEHTAMKNSLNAPVIKNKISLNNEHAPIYSFVKSAAVDFLNSCNTDRVKSHYKYSKISHLPSNSDSQSLSSLCLSCFEEMGFTKTQTGDNGSVQFRHSNEVRTPGGYFWFPESPYTMHHPNTTKTINIFASVRRLPEAKQLMVRKIDYDQVLVNESNFSSEIKVNEQYLTVTPEVEACCHNFLDLKDSLLAIQSPMGTGKSTVIKYCIDQAHARGDRVLVVTNRISVAMDFKSKYNIKSYNQDKYNVGDSLICQFDSLWKYNVKNFDVVVMDEYISLMMHSRSNLNNNSINIAKFLAVMNKKLIVADAFLTGYEQFLTSNKTHTFKLVNSYRDETPVFNYSNMNFFVKTLVQQSSKSAMTVSATSLSFIHGLSLLLTKRNLKVFTLTADTPESTKQMLYKLLEQDKNDRFDVLIYSPTLTVGVSNLNDVPVHFHYDGSMSTDAISSVQMIKRTRKAKVIHTFFKEKINYIKTTYNSIRDGYMSNIGNNSESNYLFRIDDYGELKLSNVGKQAVKIDAFKNTLEFNHRDAALWLMKYHFANPTVEVLDKFSCNMLTKYQREFKADNKLVLKKGIEQYLLMNELSKSEILESTSASVDKTMKAISIMDSSTLNCSPEIKTQILECCVVDPGFVVKCKNFNVVMNVTSGRINKLDVQYLVNDAVIQNNNANFKFFTTLVKLVDRKESSVLQFIDIKTTYKISEIQRDSTLKFVLDCCGYSAERQNNPKVIGSRMYAVDANVLNLSKYIRQ